MMNFLSSSLARPVKQFLMMLLDGILVPVALWLSFALIEPGLLNNFIETYLPFLALVSVIGVAVFYKSGLYRTILLYMGLKTGLAILKGVSVVALVLAFVVQIASVPDFPGAVLLIFWMNLLLLVGGARFAAKVLLQGVIQNFRPREPVIIYGAGSSGMQLAAALDKSDQYLPVAFVDDSLALVGNMVHGIRVYSPSSIRELIVSFSVRQILLAIPSATHAERKEILNILEHYPVHVRTVPDLFDMVSGKVSVDEIREVDIEDLLGRDTIPPDPELMGACIRGNTVLVTGAGGSIGSELCRQIIRHQPAEIILYDNSEYGLYSIESELKEKQADLEGGQDMKIAALLGSVRNREQVENAIRIFNVQTVYHAAAYKQVPMVEKNIVEGVQNNIFGTLVVVEAAEKHGVENFVLISTDKAVRPANIMGATKRFSEQILQSISAKGSGTRFSVVRFGNVLGSSGSVVPLFRKQIRNGGPVTITHSKVTRYFMTAQEAAQLVIQAGSLASGGDVFVLDMEEPVSILDLARKMIHLMGYIIKDQGSSNGDIAIDYIGLRQGEKLQEELLIGEFVTGTDHPKIMRAEEDFLSWNELEDLLSRLKYACDNLDQNIIRDVLSEAIGGFISKEVISDPMLEVKAAHGMQDSFLDEADEGKIRPLFSRDSA